MPNIPDYEIKEFLIAGTTWAVDLTSTTEEYFIYGSGTMVGSSTMSGVGTPLDGMILNIFYSGNFVLNGNTITIFGVSLTQQQAQTALYIKARYDGALAAWQVTVIADDSELPTGVSGITTTPLTAGGGSITLTAGISKTYNLITGSGVTLLASWDWTPAVGVITGSNFIVHFRATGTVLNGNNITICGKTLTALQALQGDCIVFSRFDGAAWDSILIDGYGVDKFRVMGSAADTAPAFLDTKCKESIEVNANQLHLVGDLAAPGNSFYYGTSAAGVKGYHVLPLTSPIMSVMTKAQANAAVAAATLTQGGFYLISDVHPTLYDDGTTSGTEIILQATDKNSFSHKGYGKFWNPKYNQAVSGFGIWSNRNTWTATLTGLVFNANEAITADNGATGFLVGVLADNMFIATAGNWATATYITGDVTGATAKLAGITLKTYTIGQKVIWGHYAWENVNGNVGAATDVLTLDAEWLKLPYTATDYNVTWDEIEFDFTNNWITSRYESEADNRVTETYATFGDFGYTYHAISVFQWGNHYNNSSGKGIGGNKVDESYAEFCNFQGNIVEKTTLEQKSYIKDNVFISGTNIRYCKLFSESAIFSNVVIGGIGFREIILNNTSIISLNSLSLSSIADCCLYQSNIISNTLSTNTFVCIIAEFSSITIASAQVATFYPIFAATYIKNVISTVDAKNVLITWSAIGVSTPLDLATGVTPV